MNSVRFTWKVVLNSVRFTWKVVFLFLILGCGREDEDSYTSVARSGTNTENFRPVSSACQNPGLRPPVALCSFYRDCLESAITCEDTNFPYAITFGERNCKNFEGARPNFSEAGKSWLDGTMVCLHELIAFSDGNITSYSRWRKDPGPGFDINNKIIANSCQDIQRSEFEGHPGCYLGGPSRFTDRKHPSICTLVISDLSKIFMTLESRDMLTSAAVPQMVAVAKACVAHWKRSRGPNLIRGTVFDGFGHLFASSENQKLLDLWTWKEASWTNISRGLAPLPPPASLAAELGVPEVPAATGGPFPVKQMSCIEGSPAQKWKMENDQIINTRTGLCLDVSDIGSDPSASGAEIILTTCQSVKWQTWISRHKSFNSIAHNLLINKVSGKCLDLKVGGAEGKKSGVKIVQETCTGNSTWQFWRTALFSEGGAIKNAETGMCLDYDSQ